MNTFYLLKLHIKRKQGTKLYLDFREDNILENLLSCYFFSRTLRKSSISASLSLARFLPALYASFNSVFVAFDYKNTRTLAERDTCAVIERGTGVFVKRMESVETAECK